MLYKISEKFSLGATLKDLSPGIAYPEGGSKDALPLMFSFGYKWTPIDLKPVKFNLYCSTSRLLVDYQPQGMLNELDRWQKGVGAEIIIFQMVALRGGYFIDKKSERDGFTYGAGLKLAGFSLDLGTDSALYNFKTSNTRLSLGYEF